jgi:glutathione-regulated potassium-efflux system protein KefB
MIPAGAPTLDVEVLLRAAVLILGSSVLALVVSRWLGLGSVVALLAVGLLIGPSGLPLPFGHETLRDLTELGVVLLLFLIGLEIRPQRLWAMRHAVLGMGSAQVVVTGAVLTGLAMLYGLRWEPALVIGLGLALSSTALVMQLLQERGAVGTSHGRAAFAVLLLQDLAIVPILALVPLLARRSVDDFEPIPLLAKAAALLAVVAVARYVLPFGFTLLARQRNAAAFTGLALLGVLFCAWLMEEVGLSMALGAFLAGMLLAGSPYRAQLDADIQPYKGMLLGLFFVSIGMSVDLSVVLHRPLATLVDVLVLYVVKIAVMVGLALLFGQSRANAVRLGTLLGQGGEFGFVLFAAAAATGLLGPAETSAVLLLIAVSMALTPLVVSAGDALARRLEAEGEPGAAPPPADREPRVLIAGYGRVGRSIGALLGEAGVAWSALETDVQLVAQARGRGEPVAYGNAAIRHVLEAAGIGRAAAMVVAIDDPVAAEKVVRAVRSFHPETLVVARARDLDAADRLTAAGASAVFHETLEMSLTLGSTVLRWVGVDEGTAQAALDAVRRDDFALLRRLGAEAPPPSLRPKAISER